MTGPSVVLVPGMLCDADLWSDVASGLPGALPADITAPDIAAMAEQVLAVADGPFVLVGLSLGAIVGFEVARRAPERLAGLCAMSANAAAPRPDQLAAWTEMAARTGHGGFGSVVAEQLLPTMYAGRNPSEDKRNRFLGMAHRVGPDTFVEQLAAQATRTEAFSVLDRLSCPVLVLCGEQDQLCPPSFHRDIAAHARDSVLRVVPGAGHLLPIEAPHAVSAALRDWLPSLDPSFVPA